MTRRRLTAIGLGALVGGFLAFGFTAFFGGFLGLGAIDAVLLSPVALRARPTFVASAGDFYLLVLALGATGGIVIALIAYALAREADPAHERYPLGFLLPVAAVTSALVAYVAIRSGIGVGGSIEAGAVSLSVFRMIVTAVISGVAAGAVTAWTVHTLVDPAFLGLEGAAWPATRRAFAADAMRAMAIPIGALVLAFAGAFGLSRLLLASGGAVAVVTFSVVASAVLGGATLAAARPWDRERPQS